MLPTYRQQKVEGKITKGREPLEGQHKNAAKYLRIIN